MPKPELGKVAVGDRLLVIPSGNSFRTRPAPVEGTVTTAGRVWITVQEVDGPRSWRLRLDTQDDGGRGNYHDRFLTHDQNAWEQRQLAVDTYLHEQHITVGRDSPWRHEDRRLALVNFLRAHDGLDPL